MGNRQWNYRVVKLQRGGSDAWFSYPAAATFAGDAEALEYARRFAGEQTGVVGTRIVVQARRGGRYVADLHV